jgi:hypothetical protein
MSMGILDRPLTTVLPIQTMGSNAFPWGVHSVANGLAAPNSEIKPVRDNQQLRCLKIESQRRGGQERGRLIGVAGYFSWSLGGKDNGIKHVSVVCMFSGKWAYRS